MFTWRMLVAQGKLTATASQEELSESDYLQNQVEELQRPLGKKTIEGEFSSWHKMLCYVKLDVTRINSAEGLPSNVLGRSCPPPLADAGLVDKIKPVNRRNAAIPLLRRSRHYAPKCPR
ncbi:hypothetical protein [Rhizobium mongolense]|uniref:Transposase n=1 Tax=Rhizobium mongolense TaxID=57676 RepID=A0ABR6IY69_9HYPH|nr:hypothetical protein [Rhizobium mongolense]